MDKKTVKSVILIFITVALTAAVAICAMLATQRVNRVKTQPDTSADSTQEDGFYNILFMGTDRTSALCDVMMLINVNTRNDRITIAQLPRDTYARYSESSYKKLNGAYTALGGAEETADFLSEAFGTPIHYYMCVGLDTVAEVVDTLGGVEINLPCDMKYTDKEQNLYIDLEAGYNLLDGEGAEMFLRFRSGYTDGDIGRLDAQKLFMSCLFSTLGEKFSLTLAAQLISIAEGVETNMSAYDLLWLANRAVATNPSEIRMLTLPGEALTAEKSGASYYVLSSVSTRELMEKYFCASGDFDQNEIFLNEDYESFKKTYLSKRDCFVSTIGEIVSANRK